MNTIKNEHDVKGFERRPLRATAKNELNGVVATVHELVSLRPNRAVTGFAPGGKVSTHLLGSNHSVFRGHGMEFDESRIYQSGDDNRNIDWRVTARTGKVHTKLFREERERPVLVLMDCRRMMHYGTRVCFKSVMAARIAAMLCWVGIDGGDRVGGFLLLPDRIVHFPPKRSRNGMLLFLKAISDATASAIASDQSYAQPPLAEPTLADGLRRLRKQCRPGSLAFVISDFNDLDDDTEAELKRVSRHTHLTAIRIHDPLDEQLPDHGDYRISDGNNVLSLAQLGTNTRTAHDQERRTRLERLATVCRQRSIARMDVSTEDPHEQILHPHGTKTPAQTPVWSKS